MNFGARRSGKNTGETNRNFTFPLRYPGINYSGLRAKFEDMLYVSNIDRTYKKWKHFTLVFLCVYNKRNFTVLLEF